MTQLGLNILWKFADENFFICFLVVRVKIPKRKIAEFAKFNGVQCRSFPTINRVPMHTAFHYNSSIAYNGWNSVDLAIKLHPSWILLNTHPEYCNEETQNKDFTWNITLFSIFIMSAFPLEAWHFEFCLSSHWKSKFFKKRILCPRTTFFPRVRN